MTDSSKLEIIVQDVQGNIFLEEELINNSNKINNFISNDREARNLPATLCHSAILVRILSYYHSLISKLMH